MSEHELLAAFADAGLDLGNALRSMLEERVEHRSERRGCGYTQATRRLAEQANQPREASGFSDLSLFAAWRPKQESERIGRALGEGLASDWRHWDRCAPAPDGTILDEGLVAHEAGRQARLRAMTGALEREESLLLAAILCDIVLPAGPGDDDAPTLPSWPERLPVGSCPTAEKCFLELAHGFITRNGRVNVIVDEAGSPLLVEKRNLGDDHSCVSLAPLRINGVRLPPGSLVAVHYDDAAVAAEPVSEPMPGHRIPLQACEGFRFLRLTTLAVTPENRARAFTAHFEAQRSAGLFAPDTTELAQLRALAEAQRA